MKGFCEKEKITSPRYRRVAFVVAKYVKYSDCYISLSTKGMATIGKVVLNDLNAFNFMIFCWIFMHAGDRSR